MCCVLQGTRVLEKAGGLHTFMGWDRALLTVRDLCQCGDVQASMYALHVDGMQCVCVCVQSFCSEGVGRCWLGSDSVVGGRWVLKVSVCHV